MDEVPGKNLVSQTNNEAKEAKNNADDRTLTTPPRVDTDKGFPVSQAGWQKCVEIGEEVKKRDPDLHDM